MPADYAALSRLLPGAVTVIDAWEHDPTGPVEDLRAAVLEADARTGQRVANARGADQNHSERLSLIGHSVGGAAALEWALKYPQDVERLVLLDPSPPRAFGTGWLTPGGAGERAFGPLVRQVARMLTPWGAQIRRGMFGWSTGESDHLPHGHARRRYVTRSGLNTVVDQWFSSWEQERRLSSLLLSGAVLEKRLQVVIVCSSGTSRSTPLAAQRRLARVIGAELHILPQAHHSFPVTEPHRILAALTL